MGICIYLAFQYKSQDTKRAGQHSLKWIINLLETPVGLFLQSGRCNWLPYCPTLLQLKTMAASRKPSPLYLQTGSTVYGSFNHNTIIFYILFLSFLCLHFANFSKEIKLKGAVAISYSKSLQRAVSVFYRSWQKILFKGRFHCIHRGKEFTHYFS